MWHMLSLFALINQSTLLKLLLASTKLNIIITIICIKNTKYDFKIVQLINIQKY